MPLHDEMPPYLPTGSMEVIYAPGQCDSVIEYSARIRARREQQLQFSHKSKAINV